MPVRTTIILSEEAYKKLVNMAIERYGHARAISKVVEDLIMESSNKKEDVREKIRRIIEEAKKINISLNLTPEEIDRIVEEEIEEEILRK